jgi:hypothetical protein
MKVYEWQTGEKRLIGRCDIEQDTDDHYAVPLLGAEDVRMEVYAITDVVIYGQGADYRVEKGILIAPGQDPSLLPEWQPLAS